MLIRVFDSRLNRLSLCLIREQGLGFHLLILQSSYMGRLGLPLNCVGLSHSLICAVMCGAELCSAVWCCAAWCGVVWPDAVLCSVVLCRAMRCGLV